MFFKIFFHNNVFDVYGKATTVSNWVINSAFFSSNTVWSGGNVLGTGSVLNVGPIPLTMIPSGLPYMTPHAVASVNGNTGAVTAVNSISLATGANMGLVQNGQDYTLNAIGDTVKAGNNTFSGTNNITGPMYYNGRDVVRFLNLTHTPSMVINFSTNVNQRISITNSVNNFTLTLSFTNAPDNQASSMTVWIDNPGLANGTILWGSNVVNYVTQPPPTNVYPQSSGYWVIQSTGSFYRVIGVPY